MEPVATRATPVPATSPAEDAFPSLSAATAKPTTRKQQQKIAEENRQRAEEDEQKRRAGLVDEIYRKLSDGGEVSLGEIYYSQDTCSWSMAQGTTNIGEVAEQMKASGWDNTKPSPDMVVMPDGTVVTLDHRRLVAANRADLKSVPVSIHRHDERLTKGQQARFRDPDGGRTPQTWGDAVDIRSKGAPRKALPRVT